MENNNLINNILKNNNLQQILNAIEDCKDLDCKNKIKDILTYEANKEEKYRYYEELKKKRDKDYEKRLHARLREMENDTYKIPWSKLIKLQKEIKLKEYIKDNKLSEEKSKSLWDNFRKLKVKWDKVNCKILDIEVDK
jgi:hypothetical protein